MERNQSKVETALYMFRQSARALADMHARW